MTKIFAYLFAGIRKIFQLMNTNTAKLIFNPRFTSKVGIAQTIGIVYFI